MPRPSQVLLLSRIEWEHPPCPTFFMQTPKSISFPSSYPLFNLLLVGVSFSKALTPLGNFAHVFLEFQTLMKECFPSCNQNTNTTTKGVLVRQVISLVVMSKD